MKEAALAGRTIYDKVWERHAVRCYPDGDNLLYIDRHLVQEVSSPQSFAALDAAGVRVRRPDAHLAVADHAVPTVRRDVTFAEGLARSQVERLILNSERHGITYVPTQDVRHGIVHVIGPELGFTLPGLTLVCGDSHTCTHGAFGCIAFGIGASECISVFRTQCLRQTRQKTMRIRLDGQLQPGVTAKDVILAIISNFGAGVGVGYALEFAGEAVRVMSMEERMTLCNMSIEAGSRVGMVSPDETTFAYLKGRPLAPDGAEWRAAVADWRALGTDEDAIFDRDIRMDVSTIEPQVSWGTSPELTLPVTGSLPDPAASETPEIRRQFEKSLTYMGLEPGIPVREISIDRVFIGSCTNGRLDDLRAAAEIVRGGRVADGVAAIVVPGSMSVREAAEAEGLDKVFLDAGFEWRESGCSMCVGMNEDRLIEGERCASTSNRNFEGRQGKGGRTHLMSPQMAAAAALAGRIADVREYLPR
jgi:3-isopropylmalate/(R)-2-methylmalate dehydratase large subunit